MAAGIVSAGQPVDAGWHARTYNERIVSNVFFSFGHAVSNHCDHSPAGLKALGRRGLVNGKNSAATYLPKNFPKFGATPNNLIAIPGRSRPPACRACQVQGPGWLPLLVQRARGQAAAAMAVQILVRDSWRILPGGRERRNKQDCDMSRFEQSALMFTRYSSVLHVCM